MNYIYTCTVILIIVSIAVTFLLPVIVLSGTYYINNISDNLFYIWIVKYPCMLLSFIGFQVLIYKSNDIK